jgi:hypothetical protein
LIKLRTLVPATLASATGQQETPALQKLTLGETLRLSPEADVLGSVQLRLGGAHPHRPDGQNKLEQRSAFAVRRRGNPTAMPFNNALADSQS